MCYWSVIFEGATLCERKLHHSQHSSFKNKYKLIYFKGILIYKWSIIDLLLILFTALCRQFHRIWPKLRWNY